MGLEMRWILDEWCVISLVGVLWVHFVTSCKFLRSEYSVVVLSFSFPSVFLTLTGSSPPRSLLNVIRPLHA